MNKLLASTWLLIIGTNFAQYYSSEVAYLGFTVLLSSAYVTLIYSKRLFNLLSNIDFLFSLTIFSTPIFLMLFSNRNFVRGDYTSMLSIVAIFIVTTVLASKEELASRLVNSAFYIVLIGTCLNLYELLIENNRWSIAPGRSAGFFVNPNISSEAIIGYSLLYIGWKIKKSSFNDYIFMLIATVGVITTFSRAGILAIISLFILSLYLKGDKKEITRILLALIVLFFGLILTSSFLFESVELSEDAIVRLNSLIEMGGVGDYQESRGDVAKFALALALNDPLTGLGVRTIYEMPEGPHNMFVAMMVDYGLLGTAIYIAYFMRLAIVAKKFGHRESIYLSLFFIWLLIFSFSSHNLLGSTSTIPLYGFALARIYQLQKPH